MAFDHLRVSPTRDRSPGQPSSLLLSLLFRLYFPLYPATLTGTAKKELDDCGAKVTRLLNSGIKIGPSDDRCRTPFVMPSLAEHLSPTWSMSVLLAINVFSQRHTRSNALQRMSVLIG